MKVMLTLGIIALTNTAIARPSKAYIAKSFDKAAKDVGVSANLLKAVCWAESNHDSQAFVFSDGGLDNHAFGMCQVTYLTAKGLGFRDARCKQDFRRNKSSSDRLPRDYLRGCKLFGPYTNAYYAAKYLKSRLDKYQGNWMSAIASYNTGIVKVCKTGKVYALVSRKVIYKCEVGGLLNQKYVDRVILRLNSEVLRHARTN